MLLVVRTRSSALYLCFSLSDDVDLGKFCFGCNGGQSVHVCVTVCCCGGNAGEYHTLSRGGGGGVSYEDA